MQHYAEPEKARARERVLTHAVRALTTNRRKSVVVQPSELRSVVNFALKTLRKMGRADLRSAVKKELSEWLTYQGTCVGARKPHELRVVYLCGPEPLNDLRVLQALGVNPNNVWAVESEERVFAAALASISKEGVPIKLHHGSLKDFFERVQETFDIAYLDTTGPLLGGKPLALTPVLELLRGSRLEPLSVLITNFAEVPTTEPDRYADVMTDFFRFRYNEVPAVLHHAGVDPAEAEFDAAFMRPDVRSHLDAVYSDFVTRLLTDVARNWIPAARGFRILEKQYLSADKGIAKSVIEAAYSTGPGGSNRAQILENMGDVLRPPSAYPWVSFMRSMRETNPAEPLIQHLGSIQFSGQTAEALNRAVTLLDHIVEGHWELANPELLRAIAAPWFDRDRVFTCDLPFPQLMVQSLVGTYGYPAFASVRHSLRGSYVAKSTRMFTDLFLLDQCRYYFDWFPTAAQVPARFESHAFQVLARCLMDRIWASDARGDSHPFRGSSVAGFRALRSAPFDELKPREQWV